MNDGTLISKELDPHKELCSEMTFYHSIELSCPMNRGKVVKLACLGDHVTPIAS